VQQGVEDVDGAAVDPALLQHLGEHARQHLLDGLLGGQQVPVRDGVHARGGELDLRGRLLQHIRTHVLQDGAHDHHAAAERDGVRQAPGSGSRAGGGTARRARAHRSL